MTADAAYQGRPGAYSELAARQLCGQHATLLPCDSLEDVFAAVAAGRARSVVIPIENSIVGAVPDAGRFLQQSGLTIHAEAVVRIDHVLAGVNGARIDRVRDVLSHPVALAQCANFFAANPHLQAVPAFDTAGALERVIADADRSRAAIASRAATLRYGAVVLAERIADNADNFTRFVWGRACFPQ